MDMTENKAAAIIRETTCTQCPYGYYCGKMKSCGNYECEKKKVILEALKALENMEELWEYRAIGTVEECRAAVEKQKDNKELESHDEKHILKYCADRKRTSEMGRNQRQGGSSMEQEGERWED